MNPTDRFVALLVTVLTGLSFVMAAILWALRVLWNIRGSWDRTNSELHRLVDRVGDMAERDNRLEQRLERHLEWHDKH